MTEVEFFAILKKVNSQFDPSWLSRNVEETPLDSLDLLELRSSLETRLGRPIPNSLWFASETLNDLWVALK